MTAPDGGPERRGKPDPEIQLAVDVAQLQDRQAQLASDVSELGGHVSEEITRLGKQVELVAGQVSELSEHVTNVLGDSAADPATVDWWTLNREQAEISWSQLWKWLATYLVPTYQPTRTELPDCWTAHPGMRDELSWLWCAHRAAYSPQAAVGTAAQWHLTWRNGVLQTLQQLAKRSGCTPGKCGLRGRHEEGIPNEDAPANAAYWLTEPIQEDLLNRSDPADQE